MRAAAPQRRITSIAPMPGPLRKAVLGAVAATVIAGCGSDDGTIPQGNADILVNRLDAIEANVDQGQCDGAADQAEAFKGDVNELPAPVDDEVKHGLQEAADQLVNLAANDCEVDTNTSGPDGVQPTDSTETEPTSTETTTTETTTEDTTSEEPTTEEPDTTEPQQDQSLAPDGDRGQGNGSSGGVGSDGGIGPGGGG
jgi:hypothetical protein